MTCEIDLRDNLARLVVSGDVREGDVGPLKAHYASLPHSRLSEVVFDLGGVGRFGSTAIGVLLHCRQDMLVRGGCLRLCGLPGHLRELFWAMRLDTVFVIDQGC